MALPDLDSSVGHSFGLEVDGVVIKQISEVSGLKMEQDVIELKQNTSDGKYVIKKLPGRPKAGELTLTVDGVDHVVPTGASASFEADSPHTYGNRGDVPMEMVMAAQA